MPLTVFSYGGGVQSTAALVLAAQDELPIHTFLFANVGDDSEHPATLRYVHEIAMPYAEAHGLEIVELHYTLRDGTRETLMQNITKPSQKGEVIPVRLGSGAPGIRACTSTWKIRTIGRWLKSHGATKTNPATVALGISLDEFQRMKASKENYSVNIWPLIDRRMTRQDCVNAIEHGGLPVPPKSSCFFCPFHKLSRWQQMSEDEPELFQKAVDLEAFINKRRRARGKDEVFMTDKLIPLDKAVNTKYANGRLFETEPSCDIGGFCGV